MSKTRWSASAGGVSYTYDANGSMIGGDGRSIGYSVFGKPTTISRSGRTVHLDYGPNRNRYRRIDDAGQSDVVETHYVGSVEWVFKSGNVVVTRRYLDGEAIWIRTNDNGDVEEIVQYVLKDHLGSTHLITDGIGNIAQAQSFDPFGLRRRDDDFVALTLASRLNFDTSYTPRGFTGHEGLDSVGLVHMNGRVYDPRLGRFVSGDPFVQDPTLTQNLNRYSYVFNNPLSFTDPSGYEVMGWIVRTIVVSIVNQIRVEISNSKGSPTRLPNIAGAVPGATSGGPGSNAGWQVPKYGVERDHYLVVMVTSATGRAMDQQRSLLRPPLGRAAPRRPGGSS